MRILFSLTYYFPYISGLTLYVKRLAEALSKKDKYQLSVLCYRHDKSLEEIEVINNVKVIRAKPILKISKGFLSWDFLVKSWQEARRNEVIIINLPQFEGVVPAFIGKILGKKVISIYHCEVILPFSLFNILIQNLLSLANILTIVLSEKVLTYTQDFARNSKILTKFLQKVDYIYPPILIPKIDKRIQKIFKTKIGKRPRFLIGVAARLAAEKGIEFLLEAIPKIESRIKNKESDEEKEAIKVVIAGSLNPVGEKSYQRKILKLVENFQDKIIFLGELQEEEMGSFYSLIDVLVLPSINSTESFGMVQVEAMMMGIPVVATDLPGVRIPVQKTGRGIVVPKRNSQKLAEAIVDVLQKKKSFTKKDNFIKKEFSLYKTVNLFQKSFW